MATFTIEIPIDDKLRFDIKCWARPEIRTRDVERYIKAALEASIYQDFTKSVTVNVKPA